MKRMVQRAGQGIGVSFTERPIGAQQQFYIYTGKTMTVDNFPHPKQNTKHTPTETATHRHYPHKTDIFYTHSRERDTHTLFTATDGITLYTTQPMASQTGLFISSGGKQRHTRARSHKATRRSRHRCNTQKNKKTAPPSYELAQCHQSPRTYWASSLGTETTPKSSSGGRSTQQRQG